MSWNYSKKKVTCPKCGHAKCFSQLIDEEGNVIHPELGYCDRRNKCAYEPADFYNEHPDFLSRFRKHSVSGWATPRQYTKPQPVAEPQPDVLPNEWITKYFDKTFSGSGFTYFLSWLFTKKEVGTAVCTYWLGVYSGAWYANDGAVIFPYIDIDFRVRYMKVMLYHFYGEYAGKNVKPEHGTFDTHTISGGRKIGSLYSMLKAKGEVKGELNLKQCLFGEHLLRCYPDKKVRLVESEKSAVVCSIIYPDEIWLGTAGKGNMSERLLSVLRGRDVTAYPDRDGLKEWAKKAKELAEHGIAIKVSVYIRGWLQRKHMDDEAHAKWDIADALLYEATRNYEEKMQNPWNKMQLDFPAVRKLAETFSLEEV